MALLVAVTAVLVAARMGAEVVVVTAAQSVLVVVVETATHSHSPHLDLVVLALLDPDALCRTACGNGSRRSSLSLSF